MAKNYSAIGIILKRRNHQETDRVLTVFTKHHGKIFVIAKGIRKINSRKAPSLEPFSLCKLFLVSTKTWDIVTETEIVSSFPILRKNLKRVVYAYQICEVIDRLLPEKQVNRSLFDLIEEALTKLDSPISDDNYSQEEVLLRIVRDLGYLPTNVSLEGEKLMSFLESIVEKKLKTNQLLTKVALLI